jgi:RHS repeat-associated protein
VPFGLGPKPVEAATYCGSPEPDFTGWLTSSSATTTPLFRTTASAVYGYISNVNTTWACNTAYRYDTVAYTTQAGDPFGDLVWGALLSVTGSCNWDVGTDDYIKNNFSNDCPDFDAEYANQIDLAEGTYQDGTLWGLGDLQWAHSDCISWYGGRPGKFSVFFNGSTIGNRPGSNCQAPSFETLGATQQVVVDWTAPTVDFTTPDDSTVAYRNAANPYVVGFNITENVSGFGGSNLWSLQRQKASLTAGACGTFSNDAASGNLTTGATKDSITVNQDLASGNCYQWLLNATDQNGNVAAQDLSGTIKYDSTAPVVSNYLPAAGTTVQTATTYSVSWSETEAAAGVATRSLQRQKASAATSAACTGATYANDGSAKSSASPVNETGLLTSTCYRWQLTLTDNAGNSSGAVTSGIVYVATNPPPAPGAPDLDAASDTGPLAPVVSNYVLRPDGDAFKSGSIVYTPSGDTNAWSRVDESVSDHNDRVLLQGSGVSLLFDFPSSGIPASDTIQSVTLTGDVLPESHSGGYFSIRNPNTLEIHPVYLLPTNGVFSITLTTRPWDGQPWSLADIDQLQAGGQAFCDFPCTTYTIYQFYVTVNTSGRNPPGYSTDNVTADTTPTFSGTNDPTATSVELYDGTTLIGTDSTVSSGIWSITSSLLGDGVHSITAKAINNGGPGAASPALSLTIASTGPAPDLDTASDTGPLVTTPTTQRLAPTSVQSTTGSPTIVPALGPGESAHQRVDEFVLNRYDYVRPEVSGTMVFGFPATSIGASDHITSVVVRAHVTHPQPTQDSRLVIRNPATGSVYTVLTFGALNEGDVLANVAARPWDGQPWTKADVDQLQAGAQCQSTACSLAVSQLWVEVNSAPITSTPYANDDITSDATPTFSGANSPTASRVDLLRNGVVVGQDMTVTDGTWSITAPTVPDGTWSFTALAYDAQGVLTSTLPARSVTIDTVAPGTSSAVDLATASDDGLSSNDDITSIKQPAFSGTGPADAAVFAILDNSTQVGEDTSPDPGTSWATTVGWPLTTGTRTFTARAYDLAGNGTTGPGLTVKIVGFLTAFSVSVAPTTHVGQATMAAVTVVDETGQPISTYAGSVTISSSQGSAHFPDGTVYTLSPGDTGHTFRILPGATGTLTVTASGPNADPGTSASVTSGATELTASAPATVYAGQAFQFKVGAQDVTTDKQVTLYQSLVTLTSSDPSANFGDTVDANHQYRFTCLCEGTHAFPITLNTTGQRTITVTDVFGLSAQATVNVVAAGSASNPVTRIDAVQWERGNTVDYYLTVGAGAPALTVIEAIDRCGGNNAIVSAESVSQSVAATGGSPGYTQFTIEMPIGTCYWGDEYAVDQHTLVVTDGQHTWSRAVDARWTRFSSIPGSSNFTMLDPGDPIASMTIVSRAAPSEPVDGPYGGQFMVAPNGAQYTVTAYESTEVYGFTSVGIGLEHFAAPPDRQFYAVSAGTSQMGFTDVPIQCQILYTEHTTDWNMVAYRSGDRTGARSISVAPFTVDNQYCENGFGAPAYNSNQFAGEREDRPLLDLTKALMGLFSTGRRLLATDPVNLANGSFTQRVDDFALGGLSPGLALTRHYNSFAAEDFASGADAHATLFGPGWSSNLDWSLTPADSNGYIVIHGDDGLITFVADGAGGYRPVVEASRGSLTAIAGGWKLTDLSGSGYRFDSNGRLAAVFDPNGREMTLSWDGSGHLASFTDPANRTATVTTTGSGKITRVDLPDGRYVSFTYDANGHLATSRSMDGEVLSLTADRRGRLTKISHGSDTLVQNTYDGRGRVVRQLDALNFGSSFVYDDRSVATVLVGPRGDVETNCFTSERQPSVRVDPLDAISRWTYDYRGYPATATDELGFTSRATYDSKGRPVNLVDAAGFAVTIGWDTANHLTSFTDGTTSQTTTFVSNLPTTVVRSDGTNNLTVASYTHDATTKLPLTVTTPGSEVTTYHYDSRGYVDYVIDAAGRKTTFVTDARGFVTSSVGPLGNAVGGVPGDHTTTWTYDAMGRVLTVTDPIGNAAGGTPADHRTTYTYDAFGRQLTASRASGALTTWTYDLAGQLKSEAVKQTASITATTTYEYDGAGNLTAVVDGENRRTEYGYDLANHRTSLTDRRSKVWTWTYDAKGREATRKDPTNATTSTFYDSIDRVTKITDPAGKDTTFAYDPATALLASVTDPKNHATSYGYDWLGRQTSLTNAKTETTSITYDPAGNVATLTNGRNKTTTFTWNAAHQLLTVTEPGDSGNIVTTYDYDDDGRLETRTNHRGAVESYTYDALGRLRTLLDAASKLWQTFYTNDGDIDHTIDPASRTTSYTYDLAGRRLTVVPTSPTPSITYTYDKTDRLLTMADGNGTTTYGYDAEANLTSVLRGGRTTSYTYDNAGRQATVTYPGGQGSVTTAYDSAGRPSTITDWASRVTTYHYDDASNVSSVDRPGGLTTTYAYDELDRPLSATSVRNAATLLTQGWTYDAVGNIATLTDDTGTATFTYDNLDRLTAAAYPSSQNYSYAYDTVGNLTSVTTPSGTTTYTYDLADRITSQGPVGATTGSSTRPASSNDAGWTNSANAYASDNTYATAAPNKNQDKFVKVGTFGFDWTIPANATITNVTVSVEWKVDTTASIATLGSQVYVNGAAKGTELVNTAEPTTDTTQTYSVSGLTRADLLNGALEVRVRATRGNSNTAFTASLDAVSVQVDYTIPAPTRTPTYDDLGNLTSDGTYGNRTYSYDTLGRLTGVTGNGITQTYTLDGDGNRTAESSNGVTTSFDLDVSVANPTILADGTRKFLPGDPGAGYESGGTWRNAIRDLVGSAVEYVDTAGVVTGLIHYDPFGTPRPGSTAATGIGYAGEYRDPTGLINLRARSYDPVLGRFAQRDSFGGLANQPQTANRYAYGNGNPVRNTDPSGHLVNNVLLNPSVWLFAASFTTVGFLAITGYTLVTGHDPIFNTQLSPEELIFARAAFFGVGAGALLGLASRGGKLGAAARVVSMFAKAAGRLGLAKLEGLATRIGPAALSLASRAEGLLARSAQFAARVGEATGRAVERLSRAAGQIVDTVLFGTKARVFWSGGRIAANYATEWAIASGATTIGMTRAGRVIGAIAGVKIAGHSVPQTAMYRIWNWASGLFAKGARGDVEAFLNPSAMTGRSIFRRTEYPALYSNPDVSVNLRMVGTQVPHVIR